MTVDRNAQTGLAWDELPAVITTYLARHHTRGAAATAIATFAGDAVVTDEGRTYRGRDEIERWLATSSSEYTFTTEFTGATRVGQSDFDVVQHLEGDFPGGVVDLHYRFTVDGESIRRLTIEP